MIPTKEQLTKYANLTIQKGVNIQKGQALSINAPIEARELCITLLKPLTMLGQKECV